MKRTIGLFLVGTWVLFLVGCTTIHRSVQLNLPHTDKVAVLQFANNTETPQASQRAVSISSHLLSRCHLQVELYPGSCDKQVCQYSRTQQKKMLAWAKRKGIQYVLNGAVNEWRYKVGLDGEPAVSVSLSILDVQTGQVVWSAVGSKAGGSRSSLGYTAQNLLTRMLNNVNW